MVLAGPGSGKTRVLTHRIAYLVQEKGVRPENILAVTFTNKAAGEMKTRLTDLIGERARRLSVGTFHSMCVRILRRSGQNIGIAPDFVIFDDADQLSAVRRALKALNLDENQYPPRSILSAISRSKSKVVDHQVFATTVQSYWEEVVARVFVQYEEILSANHALDFDDLIARTNVLFREHPEVLKDYQNRYRYVMVDEYQDTNHAQYRLVNYLASRFRNLGVVGDPDQSIYGWRHADITNILNFQEDYPDAAIVRLEQNYRSTQAILDVAQRIITSNRSRIEKGLWTERKSGRKIVVQELYTEVEEAQFVVQEILRLVSQQKLHLQHCAVMYRTNSQSRVLEESFLRYGVPYQLVGGIRFYERKEIKDALAHLRFLQNPHDTFSLERLIANTPAGKGIGPKTIASLHAWASSQGLSLFSALSSLAQDNGEAKMDSGLDTRSAHALQGLASVTTGLLAKRDELSGQPLNVGKKNGLLELFDFALERTGFADSLRQDRLGQPERWENILELRSVVQKYADLPCAEALTTLLQDVSLVSDIDGLDERKDAVTLTTLHAAKGLEFPAVFIVGLEERLLPHSRSLESPEELEEERRLLYVGITRAMSHLYLLHAFKRTLYGATATSEPSRFLAELPESCLERPRSKSQSGAGATTVTASHTRPPAPVQHSSVPSPAAAPPEPKTRPSFSPGDHVRHVKFGKGIVVSSKLLNGDEEITIAFDGKGVKKLAAAYANLERV